MPTNGAPLFVFDDARLGYGTTTVLDGVNLTIMAGSFVGLVGPNGSGKTTLAKTALGLLQPLAGTVRRYFERAGDDHPPPAYVPQRQAVNVHMPLSARQVAMMGRFHIMQPFGRPSADDEAATDEALARTGVDRFADRPFRALSGGQQQRTLIARALAARSPVLILDEPTNGMDLPSEAEVIGLLKELNRDQGYTVVMITHLLNLVTSAATMLCLADRNSVAAGPRDEMLCERKLSALYDTDVAIVTHGEHRLVLPNGEGRRGDADAV